MNVGLELNLHYLLFDKYYSGLIVCKSEENFIRLRNQLLNFMTNDSRIIQFKIPIEMTTTNDRIELNNTSTSGKLVVRIASNDIKGKTAVHCLVDEDIATADLKEYGLIAKEFYSLKI